MLKSDSLFSNIVKMDNNDSPHTPRPRSATPEEEAEDSARDGARNLTLAEIALLTDVQYSHYCYPRILPDSDWDLHSLRLFSILFRYTPTYLRDGKFDVRVYEADWHAAYPDGIPMEGDQVAAGYDADWDRHFPLVTHPPECPSCICSNGNITRCFD
jgi:hypothetical protein